MANPKPRMYTHCLWRQGIHGKGGGQEFTLSGFQSQVLWSPRVQRMCALSLEMGSPRLRDGESRANSPRPTLVCDGESSHVQFVFASLHSPWTVPTTADLCRIRYNNCPPAISWFIFSILGQAWRYPCDDASSVLFTVMPAKVHNMASVSTSLFLINNSV